MQTVQFSDRRDLNRLSAVGSGIAGSSNRDASRSMKTPTTDTVWKKNPTPITMPQGPSRRPAAANPFSHRLSDNLNSRKEPKLNFGSGNHTASRTVLSGGGPHYSLEGRPTVSRQNNHKRLKLDPSADRFATSDYFRHGGEHRGRTFRGSCCIPNASRFRHRKEQGKGSRTAYACRCHSGLR
ncbi:hypothetical protein C8Q78DRAFT_198942 [Trametes maxima]|nr:hypothetical protein C8Q78DRAFT_198942 [Trametes maxima]